MNTQTSNVVSLKDYREKKAGLRRNLSNGVSPMGHYFYSFVWVPVFYYVGVPPYSQVEDTRKVMNSGTR